ncbi:hypothetical protein P3W85_23415 [Cupriavidus basilensis]|uniref:ABM domain-containing protein n=1 Tax=Cupriavidus basilensis TaxID=68895 RepID=A0ABT6ATD2_9BURK|nr:hypothetical protein [Cupriavidus basilensis]MDF3835877.1 hypothetical protein [Cupriavidus basilensis]
MTQHYIEIVTYKVGNPTEADRHRRNACMLAARLPGFGGWQSLSDGKGQGARADVVLWASPEAAEAAAEIVGSSAEFADFRATITEFGSIGHYAAPAGGLALMQSGDGIEVGRFRLRQGISEEVMRAAHVKMIADHLSRQPGWRGQRLVRLQDGIFMDIAFAVTQAQSQIICDSWAGNADCQAFLNLIEPISMEFGSIA